MNVSLFRRWFALCALALFAVTWRLWTPQTVFPQIPFFAVLRAVPGWVDWIALAGVIAGLAGLLCASGEQRASVLRVPSVRGFAFLFVASLVILVLLDQHRLQVWAYQFIIIAIVLGAFAGVASSEKAFALLRLLVIGIYFWSAISKFDHTFLHSLGPELLRGTLAAFGVEPRWMRSDVAAALSLMFPLAELAVAGLLAVRRTRRFGLIASIGMHGLLLATLGPWGLDHSWGVLLWNIYFIGQNVLLFGPAGRAGDTSSREVG